MKYKISDVVVLGLVYLNFILILGSKSFDITWPHHWLQKNHKIKCPPLLIFQDLATKS